MQSTLASVGAATGVAVAFNAPISGVVYAMEEIGSVTPYAMNKTMAGVVAFSTCFAVYVGRRLVSSFLEPGGDMGTAEEKTGWTIWFFWGCY